MRPITHDRAARLLPHPAWWFICERQRIKGLRKWGRTVEEARLTASEWATHGIEEAADGTVYALRVSDTGHPIRGRIAAFLFALAARVLLPLR